MVLKIVGIIEHGKKMIKKHLKEVYEQNSTALSHKICF